MTDSCFTHAIEPTEFVLSVAIETLQPINDSRSGRQSNQKLPTTGLPYSRLPSSPSRSLEALCRKRLWIIQELTLVKEILVQCGEYTFEWRDLARCCDNLEQICDHWLTLRDKKVYRLVCKIKDSIPCQGETESWGASASTSGAFIYLHTVKRSVRMFGIKSSDYIVQLIIVVSKKHPSTIESQFWKYAQGF